jgi:hypothetical protein
MGGDEIGDATGEEELPAVDPADPHAAMRIIATIKTGGVRRPPEVALKRTRQVYGKRV